MKEVTLITDGSCLGNPGPGGWAALLRYNNQEKLITGSEPDTTNNRMEMQAIIEGLKALNEPCRVHIRTDSQYVMHAFTQGWLENWQKKNWKTSQNKPVKNQELWQELLRLMQNHKITWEWVKGHADDPDNCRVDQAAVAAAQRQQDRLDD